MPNLVPVKAIVIFYQPKYSVARLKTDYNNSCAMDCFRTPHLVLAPKPNLGIYLQGLGRSQLPKPMTAIIAPTRFSTVWWALSYDRGRLSSRVNQEWINGMIEEHPSIVTRINGMIKEHHSIVTNYYARGFRLVFYQTKQKGPTGQEAVGWPERSDKIEDWVDGRNIGVFTGHEISPGKYLVDVDFDWSDGLPLAKHILPTTEFGFGRPSRTMSHAFYTTPTPTPSMVFEGIDGRPIVELRGTKQDGTIGMQTMIPPSVHPNGEELILRMDGEIGHADDLPRRVALYAVACILYSSFPDKSFTHDARLATSGFLLQEGLTESEVLVIGTAICSASGNSAVDYKLIIKTTLAKIKQGDRVVGKGSLIKLLGDPGKKIVARIMEWLGCGSFLEDAKGKPIANNQENVKRGLDLIGVNLSFDMFSQKPMVEYDNYKGPLVDPLVNQAWLEIDDKHGFRPDRNFFNSVVDNVANKNKFHPVTDYLAGLKWDGTARIDEWLIRSAGAENTEYIRAVSRIMLLAAVRRVHYPGSKYDEMVVLESGTQGLLKSTALRVLCPDERWFSDDLPLNVDAKQIVERTLGKWIIEASDLSGMRSSAIEHLKGMLSRQVDGPVRLAYGRIPVEQPRQFIVIGTTNSYSYLTDTTGNRRFWPIRVKMFDIPWILENRDQIWAEANSRRGEPIRLDPSLFPQASLQQEKRRAEDPWELKLSEVFDRGKKWRLTWDEVWAPLGIGIDKRDPRSHARVLRAMETLGFRRMTVRRDEAVIKGFGRDIEFGQVELGEMENL